MLEEKMKKMHREEEYETLNRRAHEIAKKVCYKVNCHCHNNNNINNNKNIYYNNSNNNNNNNIAYIDTNNYLKLEKKTT